MRRRNPYNRTRIPMETVRELKTKLRKSFSQLRKEGYFARQNFLCCQSCGWAGVPENKANSAVFYHKQDNDGLYSRGDAYLAWSGDGNRIVEVLRSNNVKVEWNGEQNQRILVKV